MQNCGIWFVLIAVMAFTTLVAGGDDKSKVQNQHQQQQQQADVMRAIADIGSPSMSQPSVDSYLESDPLQVPYEYNTAKRAHKQYGFGLGKRLYRQYQFGLGKRASSKQYGFGLGKRAALKQYGFGLGKRTSPTFYSFGLGRRASPQYSFGLGKRVSNPSFLNVDEKEADYNDLSEEKKRTSDDVHGQRFAFGLGKRGASLGEWADSVDDSTLIWHPAVRRARLQYGFGLGKRDDYDAGSEYEDDIDIN